MNRWMKTVGAGVLALLIIGCDDQDAVPEQTVPADRVDVPVNGVQVPAADGTSVEAERLDVDVDLGDGAAANAPVDGEVDSTTELRQERRQERRQRIGEALEDVDVRVDDANVDVKVE